VHTQSRLPIPAKSIDTLPVPSQIAHSLPNSSTPTEVLKINNQRADEEEEFARNPFFEDDD